MNKTLRQLLSKRQFQVCGFLGMGFQYKEIAAAMKISRLTVMTLVHQCFERTGLDSGMKLAIRYVTERERGLYE